MEDFPNLPIKNPHESLQKISQSALSRGQKLLLASLIAQARVFIYRFPNTTEDLLILDVTHFLNHRINTKLITAIGEELATAISIFNPELILTAPSSGNIPAIATATQLPNMPDIIYAPKGMPITINDAYQSKSRSYTHGGSVDLTVSRDCLPANTKVAICDDFLDTGKTALDLINIVKQAQANISALFFVIEKPFGGREELIKSGIPNEQIISLIKIDSMRPGKLKINGFDFWFELTRQ
jgi:xanthine phosphoribosyltransferase